METKEGRHEGRKDGRKETCSVTAWYIPCTCSTEFRFAVCVINQSERHKVPTARLIELDVFWGSPGR